MPVGRARRGISAPVINVSRKPVASNGISTELSHVYEGDSGDEDRRQGVYRDREGSGGTLNPFAGASHSMSKLNLVVKDETLTVEVHPS